MRKNRFCLVGGVPALANAIGDLLYLYKGVKR